MTKKKILLYSKEKIEKTILEDKKKQIINPFAFFFKGNNNENKNELSEKEKEELDNLCKIENIENYLMQKIDNKQSTNPIQRIILDFIKKLNIEIIFSKITLILINNNNSIQIHINEILTKIKKNENTITSQFFLKDIYCLNIIYGKISFFNEKINNDHNVLSMSLLEDKTIDINFNFKEFQLDEQLFFSILSYIFSIKFKKEYDDIFNEQCINLKIKNYISLYNKINFPFIPTISIFTSEDRITLQLSDLKINEDLSNFSFFFNISLKNMFNDSILPLYEIKINKEKDKNYFQINLDSTINLSLDTYFVAFILNFYLKYDFKNNDKNNIYEENGNNNDNVFNCFNLNFQENLGVDLFIKDMTIKLNELNNSESKCYISNIYFPYNNIDENNEYFLSFDHLEILIDKNSDFLLFFLKYNPNQNTNVCNNELFEEETFYNIFEGQIDLLNNKQSKTLNLTIMKFNVALKDENTTINFFFF